MFFLSEAAFFSVRAVQHCSRTMLFWHLRQKASENTLEHALLVDVPISRWLSSCSSLEQWCGWTEQLACGSLRCASCCLTSLCRLMWCNKGRSSFTVLGPASASLDALKWLVGLYSSFSQAVVLTWERQAGPLIASGGKLLHARRFQSPKIFFFCCLRASERASERSSTIDTAASNICEHKLGFLCLEAAIDRAATPRRAARKTLAARFVLERSINRDRGAVPRRH